MSSEKCGPLFLIRQRCAACCCIMHGAQFRGGGTPGGWSPYGGEGRAGMDKSQRDGTLVESACGDRAQLLFSPPSNLFNGEKKQSEGEKFNK